MKEEEEKVNAKIEIQDRVDWIKNILKNSGAKGIIYGNSGGKDCTLVGALCALATKNVLGVIMPCESKQNFTSDRDDALLAGNFFGIEQIEVDLTDTKTTIMSAFGENLTKNVASDGSLSASKINVNPRLRMTTLYALGQAKGYLVAGTGNLDEITMGYFTKWGDGAYDFNPIADLNVAEVYMLLEELNAPKSIIGKAPSAGLYQGQTDENDLGISYREIDKYLKGEAVSEKAKEIIEKAKQRNAHKLRMPEKYSR